MVRFIDDVHWKFTYVYLWVLFLWSQCMDIWWRRIINTLVLSGVPGVGIRVYGKRNDCSASEIFWLFLQFRLKYTFTLDKVPNHYIILFHKSGCTHCLYPLNISIVILYIYMYIYILIYQFKMLSLYYCSRDSISQKFYIKIF